MRQLLSILEKCTILVCLHVRIYSAVARLELIAYAFCKFNFRSEMVASLDKLNRLGFDEIIKCILFDCSLAKILLTFTQSNSVQSMLLIY